ncbi:MAG: hypothetical protein KBD31_01850 [Proteobacteria bacterium]|nr:hypothetical protein [Pseudomonadota bacterium]
MVQKNELYENVFIDPSGKSFKQKISNCIYELILGKTIKEISYELGLSHRTVEEYINYLKRIFNCTSKSQIISRIVKDERNKDNVIVFFQKL